MRDVSLFSVARQQLQPKSKSKHASGGDMFALFVRRRGKKTSILTSHLTVSGTKPARIWELKADETRKLLFYPHFETTPLRCSGKCFVLSTLCRRAAGYSTHVNEQASSPVGRLTRNVVRTSKACSPELPERFARSFFCGASSFRIDFPFERVEFTREHTSDHGFGAEMIAWMLESNPLCLVAQGTAVASGACRYIDT